MGVHVMLEIDPRGIDPADWEAAFDETVMLLSAWQPPLLGWSRRVVEGVRVAMYTNAVVNADSGAAHWCVVGDRESLQTADRQLLHRSLFKYRELCREAESKASSADIVVDAARADNQDNRKYVTVLGDATQGHPYHLAVLAAAMLIEERFPQHAMVSGDIDRGQAKEAARLAGPILKRVLPLPVRVDAPRLIVRLRGGCEPAEIADAFHRVYLGEFGADEAVLRAFPGEAGAKPWRAALTSHQSPSATGVVRLLIDWLNSGRRLSDACRFACLDPTGPRYAAEAFVNTLALTWVAVPMSARRVLEVFQKPNGAPRCIASLFGSFFCEIKSLGCLLRINMELDEIAHELSDAFGAAAVALLRRLFEQSVAIEGSLSELTQGVAALVEQAELGELDRTESLVTIQNVDALSEAQELWLRVMAWKVTRTILRLDLLPGGRHAFKTTRKARQFIARMIAEHGPIITEDAWTRIDAEQSLEVLNWCAALVSLQAKEVHLSQVRRALLENPRLLQRAMLIASDASQMNTVEKLVTIASQANHIPN